MRLLKSKMFHIVFVSLVLIFLGEGAVRLRAYWRTGAVGVADDELYTTDPQIGKVLRPNVHRKGVTGHISINSLGFLGPEFPRKKPPGTYRIVVLGDSAIFGGFPSDNDIITAQIQYHLARLTGRDIHVVNASVPGYTITSALKVYRHRVRELSPDMVLVCQILNDRYAAVNMAFAPTDSSGAASLSQPFDVARMLTGFRDKNFLVYHLIRKNLTPMLSPIGTGSTAHDTVPTNLADAYRSHLTALIRAIKRDHTPVVVTTAWRAFSRSQTRDEQLAIASLSLMNQPYLSLEGLHAAFESFDEALRRTAQEEKIPVIDMAKMFPADPTLFKDLVHLNTRGHAAAGKMLAEQIYTLMKTGHDDGI